MRKRKPLNYRNDIITRVRARHDGSYAVLNITAAASAISYYNWSPHYTLYAINEYIISASAHTHDCGSHEPSLYAAKTARILIPLILSLQGRG